MSAEEPEAWTVQPGDVIDSYVVERKLGEGGMGAVYKGHHRDTKYPVAIKILVASASVYRCSP